jgi:hypothetical protein
MPDPNYKAKLEFAAHSKNVLRGRTIMLAVEKVVVEK